MRFVCGDVRTSLFRTKLTTDLRIGAKDPATVGVKNLLSRDFRHRSIFDFCNNIGQKAKRFGKPHRSAASGRPNIGGVVFDWRS